MRYVSTAGVGPSRRRKLDGNGSRRQHAARHGSSPFGARRRRALRRGRVSRRTAPASSDQPLRFQARQSPAEHSTWSRGRAAQKRSRRRTSRCRRWQPLSALRHQQKTPKEPSKEPAAAATPELPPSKEGEARRAAKRRPAAPPRARIAANDDAPSIGGLIFSLQQKPSNRPFMLAAAGSGGWLAVGGLLAWAMLSPEIARSSFLEALASPYHDHRGGHDLPAHRAVLVPRHAGVARTRAQAHVLGHDRGRRSPRRAGPGGGTIGGVSRTGRAPPSLVHERSHLARTRTRRRTGGAGPQRSGIAGEILRRERAQDPGADPGTGR